MADPTAVALPPSDDTNYNTSSPVQPTKTPTRTDKHIDIGDEETPRPRLRPSTRGGKFHPGSRLDATPGVPRQDSASSDDEGSQQSDLAESDAEDNAKHFEREPMQTDDVEESENEDYDSMDQTVAVNIDAPLADQFGRTPGVVRAQRLTTLTSPGRTPARKPSDRNDRFTPFNRAPSSLFGTIQQTPFLSHTTPHRLNAMQSLAANATPALTYDSVLQEKEEEIIRLRAMLAETQGEKALDDFINFSPEKQTLLLPEEPHMSAMKRGSPRRHPGINTSPVAPTGISHEFRSSPLKPVPISDRMLKPITTDERREARRRRVTQEFRDFSALDLNSLRDGGSLPEPIVEEQEEEKAVDQQLPELEATEGERHEEEERTVEVAEAEPMTVEEEPVVVVEKAETQEPEAEAESEELADAPDAPEEKIDVEILDSAPAKPSLYVPPLNRYRPYRSGSAPPVPEAPQDMEANSFTKFTGPITSAADINEIHAAEVAHLTATITDLEHKLDAAGVYIERLRAELRLRTKMYQRAEGMREFLELERRVAMEAANRELAAEKSADPAAVPLPPSPSPAVATPAPAPAPVEQKSHMNRPGSRLGSSRPESRMEQPAARPPTRSAMRNPPVSSTAATRKRQREEPAPAATANKRSAVVPPKVPAMRAPPARATAASSAAANTAKDSAKPPVGRSTRAAAGSTAPSTSVRPTSRAASRAARR
ncbi:hypothetical protein BZA77DRAFT_299614 [Pyronema omphalodes]|nr:hypothetical protein BZA77DRAFT_299614 [Pyronema omphalodes]